MQGQVVSVGLVVGMCVTLAAFTALAGDDPDKKGKGGKAERSIDVEEMRAGAAERFAKVDADGDGKVTPEEFASARKGAGRPGADRRWRGPGPDARGVMRKRMEGKMRDRRGERRGDRREMREMLSDSVFDEADGDGDGKLSKEEVRQLPQAARSMAQRCAFDRLDADGDGTLTVIELSPRVAVLEKMDTDGDGKVGRDKMRDWRKQQASADGKKKCGWRKHKKDKTSGDADAGKTD